MIYNKLCKIFLVLTLLLCPMGSFAENIDPNNDNSQYAYGENVGWFNAEPSGDGGPGVEVEDSKLTGYIWAENIGWVSLSCENTSSCATVDYGVANDGNGKLSGYAWSENVGWISFSCENTNSCGTVDYGVTIDPSTGEFSGHAWGENIGWITLHSTGPVLFGVTTSWALSIDDPLPDIKANGSDELVILNQGNNLNVSIALDPGNYTGRNADWWLLLFYYHPFTGSWVPIPLGIFQAPLLNLPPVGILNTSGLPQGVFIFYFAVDMDANGTFDPAQLYSDLVVVLIQ